MSVDSHLGRLAMEAITIPDGWDQLLCKIANDLQVTGVGLHVRKPTGDMVNAQFSSSVGFDAAAVDAEAAPINPRYAVSAFLRQANDRVGTVFTDREVSTPEAAEREQFYQDYAKTYEMFNWWGGYIIADVGTRYALSAHHGIRWIDPSHEDRAEITHVLYQLGPAVELYERFQKLNLDTISQLLEQDTACAFLSKTNIVINENKAFEKLIARRSLLRRQFGRLYFTEMLDHANFENLISKDVGGKFFTKERSTGKEFKISITPYLQSGFGPDCVSKVILCEPLRNAEQIDLSEVSSIFRFTPSEQSTAEHLLLGKGTEQIAADRGVQISTVRTHVLRLLEKTNTESRVELISCLHRYR